MPSIAETRQELVHLVLPEHANVHGNLFGGRMMPGGGGAARAAPGPAGGPGMKTV